MENGKIGGVMTPKPLNRLTKFGIGDSWRYTLHAKFKMIAPSESDLTNGLNITFALFVVFVTSNFAHIQRLNCRSDFCAF